MSNLWLQLPKFGVNGLLPGERFSAQLEDIAATYTAQIQSNKTPVYLNSPPSNFLREITFASSALASATILLWILDSI